MRLDRMLTRAAGYGKVVQPSWKAALGNNKPFQGGLARRGKGVTAATAGVTWVSEGQPLRFDWTTGHAAVQMYLTNVWVMQCVRVIANTIAELPWVAGMDPTTPATYTPAAPLAKFLGPSTPVAPGGPNPSTSARAFWAWSICQYLVTGRFAWEAQLTGRGKDAPIVALWPLVSAALLPKPTIGGSQYFDGFQYVPATGTITLANEQVIYCWRPSIEDWRQPESVLQAAQLPVFISKSIDRYMANLLKNDLVATTMVISPPFDEAAQRRAWQDQFLSEFTGIDKVGNTIFAEFEPGETTPQNRPLVQVERLAQTVTTAHLTEIAKTAKIDITIAFGVPESLLGNAATRCLRGSEYVRLSNGERHQAKDLVGRTFKLLAPGPQGQREVDAYASWENVVECFAVTTESGRRLETNAKHPLYAATYTSTKDAHWRSEKGPRIDVRGWTPVGELEVGDLVAVTDGFDQRDGVPYDIDAAKVLAYIVGDGCCSVLRRGPILLSTPDKVHLDEFAASVRALGDEAKIYKSDGTRCPQMGVSGGNVRKLLHVEGLMGHKGDTKFVPSSIFAATREAQRAFISRLFACDGCASVAKEFNDPRGRPKPTRTVRIYLATISHRLALDVQELLMRFGIPTRVAHQTMRGSTIPALKGRTFGMWAVDIATSQGILDFSDQIGIYGKEEAVARCREIAATRLGTGHIPAWRTRHLMPGLRWERVRSVESVGIDATVGISVPEGNTYLSTFWEHNTFANASSEYKNFWTITVLSLISELQDHINNSLARRIGTEVGWFDLARVDALKPPKIFMPPTITSVIATGVATPAQVQNALQIPPANATTDESTTTVTVDVETSTPFAGTSSGGMSDHRVTVRVAADPERRALLNRWYRETAFRMGTRYEEWPDHVNTTTLKGLHRMAEDADTPIRVRSVEVPRRPSDVGPGIERAKAIEARVIELRSVALSSKLTREVNGVLARTYPEDARTWVEQATWSGPQKVALDDIATTRRPGGRDQEKVQGMAASLVRDPDGEVAAPIVVVKTPSSDKLKVADGYHRTLAHRRVGHDKIDAYVGTVEADEGPWDREMYEKKLNRSIEQYATYGIPGLTLRELEAL